MNEQLSEYVRKAREQEMSEEQIRQNLVGAGWQEGAVNEALGGPAPAASGVPVAPSGTVALKPASVLLKDAWQIYTRRFGTLVLISLVPLLFFIPAILYGLLTQAEIGQGGRSVGVAGIGIIAFVLIIAGIVASIFSQIATVIALRDRAQGIGVIESYKRTRGFFWGYIWVVILGFLAITGGFILLIIPGIIVTMWLVFDYYIRIVEGDKGLNALLKSKEYVKGRWWSAFWRILVVLFVGLGFLILVSLVMGFILSAAKVPDPVISLLGNILGFIIGPYFAVYLFLMYDNFRDSHGPIATPLPGRGKMIALAIVGLVLIPLGFFSSIVLVSLNSAREKSREAQFETGYRQIRISLEIYKNDNQVYPTTLEQLNDPSFTVPKYDHSTYTYTFKDGGQSYELCRKFRDTEEICEGPEPESPSEIPDLRLNPQK